MSEGLSAIDEIAEHTEEHKHHQAHGHSAHERWLSIAEAVVLSIVALMAAWSGYSAAQWDSESSTSIAESTTARAQANRNAIEAMQVQTLDSVRFNAAFGAYAANDPKLFRLAVDRLRPGYRAAFDAWVATHPLKNPDAAPDPSYMPQYRVPQQARAHAFDARADELFADGQASSNTADKYVRLTVVLAAVLFLIGISSHFPVRAARSGLVGIAGLLLVASVAELLTLPGPPG